MATVQVQTIVDQNGRVIAAKLGGQGTESADQDIPSVSLRPLEGQRHVTFEVPAEVTGLAGHHLERFFSHVSVSWPAEVQLPDIEIVRAHSDE